MPASANDYRFSGRLLYRAYFALVICIIAIGSALDYVVSRSDESDRLEMFRQHHEPLFAMLESELLASPTDGWPAVLQRFSAAARQDFQWHSFEDFAADSETTAQLQQGELLALFDKQDRLSFYRRVGSSDYILSTAVPTWDAGLNDGNWVVPVFYILIAIAVFLLLLPFSRHLLKLKSAAASFGAGDFSTRIDLPAQSTLAPITDAFNAMAGRIEHLVLVQRDLTNSVSHELRTPLARLKFAFEEVEQSTTEDDVLHQVREMKRNVIELEVLIDEMLRYAEINQIQDLVKTAVPLRPLIDDVVQAMPVTDIAIETQFDASIPAQAQIACDEHHLHRALANVLRNALRFARSRCELYLTRTDTALLVDISDDGPGLEPGQQERVFEPFYKGGRRERERGYGLGLSIAQRIAAKHGGTLSVSTARLSGAGFRFTLPHRD